MADPKMLVEIWSDVMCPFCYLGKRRFARALEAFEHRDDVEVAWKSFQLAPSLRTDPTLRTHEYLAREKGLDVAVARQMNARLADAGRQEGIAYDFDRVVVANTFRAHRLLHFARAEGRQDAMADRLFRAHFGEGRNVDDVETLVELGADAGLDRDAVRRVAAGDEYAGAVRADIEEARALGVDGVPFFVFDRRYAVSGAQDSAIFGQALARSHEEWVADAAAGR